MTQTQEEKYKSSALANSSSKESSAKLSAGLFSWYAVCSSETLDKEGLYFFSMFNEPLVLYRDKNSHAVCIKDFCPHRGPSFRGGEVKSGDIVCPYHGAEFSANSNGVAGDKITCTHIVDSNYDSYAKRVHLYQYPCVEKDDYLFIYYTGKANPSIEDFGVQEPLETHLPGSLGFDFSEFEYVEVLGDFKCDWARIIENHLDILHIYWMHGNSLPDKGVNRDTIKSFDQLITKGRHSYRTKYMHKGEEKEEFITQIFVPPGRIIIYKGTPESARYVQVLDHIPMSNNRARVILRHYRKFLKNKIVGKLILFKPLQHRTFYRIFKEDYLVLRTQTFNHQMGYMEKGNVKLLGEDKMIQHFWDWHQRANAEDAPWTVHSMNENVNAVNQELSLQYPPENPSLARKINRTLRFQVLLRFLPVIAFVLSICLRR